MTVSSENEMIQKRVTDFDNQVSQLNAESEYEELKKVFYCHIYK